MQSSNKEFFAIGKAAAIATATVDGYAAVVKALDAAPPPFNFVLAGIVGAAVAVNIDKIASASPPGYAGGIDSVPGIGFGDKFPALLEAKERVVPGESNKDLTTFLAKEKDRGGGRGDTYYSITLQVMGNVFDRRESGLQMMEAINEAIRASGGRFVRNAVAS